LRLDPKLVREALTDAPAQQLSSRSAWHVRDGMPAIFRRVFGIDDAPDALPKHPKDRLDHFRAERERLKLAAEQRAMIPLIEVESAISQLLKSLAQTLETLPAALERDYGLSAEETARLHAAMDAARDALHAAAIGGLDARPEA